MEVYGIMFLEFRRGFGGGGVSFENVQNVRGAEVLRPSIRILFKSC